MIAWLPAVFRHHNYREHRRELDKQHSMTIIIAYILFFIIKAGADPEGGRRRGRTTTPFCPKFFQKFPAPPLFSNPGSAPEKYSTCIYYMGFYAFQSVFFATIYNNMQLFYLCFLRRKHILCIIFFYIFMRILFVHRWI